MNPIKIGQQIAKRLLAEELTEKVSIYPGAFKPPHKGHVRAALSSIDDKTDKVIIFMSSKERDGVSVEEAQKVWDLYKSNIPELDKIEIVQTPTPVTAVYDYAKDNPTHDIRAVFGKGEQERFKSLLDKEKYPHVEVFDSGTVGTYSATDLRKALRDNDIERIKEFLPDEINIDDFLAIFQTNEGLFPKYNAKKVQQTRYKASDVWTNDPDILEEDDPKTGTGKKPKGSGRRLYTDEDPSDTVGVKFSTRQDIVDTLSKTSFKNKSHARQSQIINLIHQRVRAAYNRAKDPEIKKRLKSALDYAEQRKEASKEKTQRLNKEELQETFNTLSDKLLYYLDYYKNLSPSTFDLELSENKILINIPDYSFKNLYEIGDLSQQPYPWKYLPDNSDDTTKVYRFEAKDDIQYEVNLYYVGSYNDKGDWTLEFLAKAPGLGGYSSKALTGGGEPLKIMSTIVDITKAFVKDNGNVGRIVYTPTEGKSGERDAKDNIRGKLYKAIIKKNFPQAKITGSDNSAVIVDLTKQPLNESWHPNKAKIINRFIDYATNYLSIDRPTIKLINTPDYTQHNHSFGGYMPSEKKLLVVVHNRNMADILRTLAHELVHHMQNLDNRLQPNSGMDGSPEENEANSLAAVIMRKFGRENPEIYE
jgi:hypothetical protein